MVRQQHTGLRVAGPEAQSAAQMRLGHLKEGSAHLKKALFTTRWQLPEGIYYLALAYRRMGMPERAERTYAVLRRASPRLAASYRTGSRPGPRTGGGQDLR